MPNSISMLLALIVTGGLSACGSLQRDAQSGYGMDHYQGLSGADSLYEQRAQKQALDAREELGLAGRPLSDPEQRAVELRIKLTRLEGKLVTNREKKQYYNVRSGLGTDQDRIIFLSLPTFESRARWAQQRGLGLDSDEIFSEAIAKTIDANDIALGMSQKAVMQSWGDPDAVEVAGNALFGFERWKYNRYVSGDEGYQKEMRVVYFEGGRVVGWERP